MPKGIYTVPAPVNEVVKSYAPNSPERAAVKAAYDQLWNNPTDVPLYIGQEEIRTGKTKRIVAPHDHAHNVGQYHTAEAAHVTAAIEGALVARKQWNNLAWEHRASIFLKAAELIAGPYRARINAATMIGQSKTIFQAEIDSACELIDFLRYNVKYMTEIYAGQPKSNSEMWNRVEYRALEGFVYAVTPFNFTAISGNLPASAALMGNVVVWKPSANQMLSAQVLMEVFLAAGLPKGVINMVAGDSAMITDIVLNHKDFAGVHYTGSTGVFNNFWKVIGEKVDSYRTYPRIVGETGGKDFILAHPTSNAQEVATAITRGAFEYQGQKCSAASRAYLPKSLWAEIEKLVGQDLATIKMGTPADFTNFVTAVIHERSFDNLASYIDRAKNATDAKIAFGGKYDKSKGYFIEPTVIVTSNPTYETMVTELFGPVMTIYIYEDEKWAETLELVDSTSPYALTGAIFSGCRYAIEEATRALEHAAGNFYINDKPTGAVVGMQPFGGSRASGTNDKAGSAQNLMRWVSPRAIKETFVPATDYRYPFLQAE